MSVLAGVVSWLLIPATIILWFPVFWVGLIFFVRVVPPRIVRYYSRANQRKPFDRTVSLRLTDKPNEDKKTTP